jgi:Omp85 superfamily domain
VVAFLLAMPPCFATDAAEVAIPDAAGPPPPPPPPPQIAHWYDLSRLPFIPVPSVGADPNSGTTVGILPVWLHTDEKHNITRIIAPDITHNPFFGWGFHGRVFSYQSEDEQWSVVGGARERVERGLDGEYQLGRLRGGPFTSISNAAFDRDGTPRFFGVGNNTRLSAQTNYTSQISLLQEQIGWNFSHTWQLLYTMRKRIVQVLPGTLTSIPSIETRYPQVPGLGTNGELLNRYSVVYDTRDDLTVPQRGMRIVLYGGLASRGGIFNDSLYSEAGGDARGYWPVASKTILAAHMSLRYLPTTHDLPFWALSSIGGDQSDVGGQQLLRGYGAGRFEDRNAFSGSIEARHTVWSFEAASTHIDLEVAPFVDVGQVFARTSTFPLERLHKVGGVGFRGIARPSVVGYVDVGYGSEGAAVFTGINYPF